MIRVVKETIGHLKILFVYLAHPKQGVSEREREITELWNLVASMGDASVMDLILQKGEEFQATYIGPGKAQEVYNYLSDNPIDIVIFNGQLTTNQKFNLLKMYWKINPNIQVWDRIDLLLAIFSRHAHTKEATLQIDLARMKHMGPRIFGMGMVLSRQGGGIGTRGIGETNTELMKRHWKREIKRVQDELAKATENRRHQMEQRKDSGLKTISLVGYTNAGKTSLFNLLTQKKKLVQDALFATLDSTVGKVYIPELESSVIVSDTIGFIANLPPDVIDAFKSTLMESVHAEIILHVIDVTDPIMQFKIDVVDDILIQLAIPKEKVIRVFNKIDAAKNLEREAIRADSFPYPCFFLSTKTHQGLDLLLSNLASKIH